MTKQSESDAVITSLIDQVRQYGDCTGPLIWVHDQQPITEDQFTQLKAAKVILISARYDICLAADRAGVQYRFCDYELEHFNALAPAAVFFPVAKERALVHHVINCALISLANNRGDQTTTLWLSGHKNQGIKTHIAKTAAITGTKPNLAKKIAGIQIAEFRPEFSPTNLLESNHYSELRQIQGTDQQLPIKLFWSKPGVFGWEKIDQGSALLCRAMSDVDFTNKQVLDLGCGYGLLSLYALNRPQSTQPASLFAVDNCQPALLACEKNLLPYCQTTIRASDAGNEVSGHFDLILCNPPFHEGFGTSRSLLAKFINNIARLLSKSGEAWVVCNSFQAVESMATNSGLTSTLMTNSGQFKVLKMTKARPE